MKACNIHIENSYAVRKRDFDFVLSCCVSEESMTVKKNRSAFSLKTEWAVHNLLYALHIARSRTKDVDLQIPQKWYEKIAYPVLGCIVWIFIK